jgi:hypothetical protein
LLTVRRVYPPVVQTSHHYDDANFSVFLFCIHLPFGLERTPGLSPAPDNKESGDIPTSAVTRSADEQGVDRAAINASIQQALYHILVRYASFYLPLTAIVLFRQHGAQVLAGIALGVFGHLLRLPSTTT